MIPSQIIPVEVNNVGGGLQIKRQTIPFTPPVVAIIIVIRICRVDGDYPIHMPSIHSSHKGEKYRTYFRRSDDFPDETPRANQQQRSAGHLHLWRR
jgi:hypothetical protein